MEPYPEYYQRNDEVTFRDENGAYGINTTLIHDIIRKDKPEE